MYPSPKILAAAYEYIKTVPPVNKWKLPPAEEVEFRITKDRNVLGQHTTYRYSRREHIIYISGARISFGDTLLRVLAHEMVHASLAEEGRNAVSHNKEFHSRAKELCKAMGWDEKDF